jgi:two-component system response regulator NreC
MPEMDGLEATRRIVQSSVSPKVLILTMHNEDDLIVRCLEAGASGFILKDAPSSQLLDAVKQAFKGEKYFSPGIPDEVVQEFLPKSARPKDRHYRLSSLEREILNLLAEGSTVREIASSFRLNAETIEVLQYNLMRKIGARNRTELVEYAIKKEIVRASTTELKVKYSGKKAA